MTKTRTNPATAPISDHCPVVALGTEFKRLVAIDNVLEAIQTETSGEKERIRFDLLRDAVRDFALDAVPSRAARLRAQSAAGALFQIACVADIVDDLAGAPAAMTVADRERLARAADRLLYSIVAFIEKTTPARLEDIGADYFLDRRLDPFKKLDEAEQIAAGTEAGR